LAENVTLIDAMAWIFRAYYSEPETLAPDGTPANASFGFLHFLLRTLARERPTHIAVAFDVGRKTFRNEIFPDYKANRSATPPDLLPQFAQCESLVDALGLARYQYENHEADDVLATLAASCRREGMEVTILSGDKDLAQLVDPGLRVMDPSRNRRFTIRTVKKHFGVEPWQMVDLLALTGDSSDNVPGVPGVGPKTATALLQAHGSFDEIYRSLDSLAELPIRGAKKLGARLAEHRELAETCRELVRLRSDLPLHAGPEDLRWPGADRPVCEELFGELGFENSISAVPRWRNQEGGR